MGMITEQHRVKRGRKLLEPLCTRCKEPAVCVCDAAFDPALGYFPQQASETGCFLPNGKEPPGKCSVPLCARHAHRAGELTLCWHHRDLVAPPTIQEPTSAVPTQD